MGRVLVIVESPTKAKTIKRFLGRGYTVKSSMGHVRDLPRSQFGVDVENDFEPKYITIRGKGKTLKEIRDEAKKSTKVLLGTDPDREGEAIAWHLHQALDLDKETPCRIQFNEITKPAIKYAVAHPQAIQYAKVDAQQARRVLDRLVGYNLSPLLWKKVRKGLSAGRVQSVAVKMILDREREIQDFEPQEYWSLTGLFNNGKQDFEASLAQKNKKKLTIENEQQMHEVIKEIENAVFAVDGVNKRKRKRKPMAPLVTSTLQQEAYKRYNFTARKTMMIAQQLYEGIDLGDKQGSVGLISYIRTDSTRISDEARAKCGAYISEKFGKEYVPAVPNVYGSPKKAQEAHEAVRPTSPDREPESLKNVLSRDQYKLYTLIWERFVASQMESAVMNTTLVDISAGDYLFKASGSTVEFPGFLKLFIDRKSKGISEVTETLLPELNKDDVLKVKSLDPKQHFTQPPARYTEGSLVKALEDLGIGRPSTYAPIIETIVSRGYVVREDKQFYPTELGTVVIDLLEDYFKDILNVEFTANLETKLDKIEAGELKWKDVVREFYQPFNQELEKAEKEIDQIEIKDEVTDKVCDKCGRNMVIKYGRYGKFLACSGFPECRNAKPFLEEIGVTCPLCGGQVVQRRSRKGRKFYGCSNFPDCEYISWNKPSNMSCPECGTRLVEKTSRKKGTKLVCPNEKCHFEFIPPKEEAGGKS